MPATSPRILIVEDDPNFRALLVMLFGRFRPHVQVTEAANGHEAYTRYHQVGADLIITGDQMPLLCGIDLIRRLRTQAVTTPVLLLSGDPRVNDVVANDRYTLFAIKPVLLEQFLQMVDALLGLL